MAVIRKSVQKLTYLRPEEGAELDQAVAESELSCAEFIRQAVLEALEQRRQSHELMLAAGDFVIVSPGDGSDDEHEVVRPVLDPVS